MDCDKFEQQFPTDQHSLEPTASGLNLNDIIKYSKELQLGILMIQADNVLEDIARIADE